jgi:hypothetical protein
MDELSISNELSLNTQASKAAMADEASTSPRPLQPTVDYTSDNREDATTRKKIWKDLSGISNVSWKSPEVTEFKGGKDEFSIGSSEATTMVERTRVPTSRNAEKETNASFRWLSLPPGCHNDTSRTTAEQSTEDSNETEVEKENGDKESSDEWNFMGDEIEPEDSASRPRHLPRSRPAPSLQPCNDSQSKEGDNGPSKENNNIRTGDVSKMGQSRARSTSRYGAADYMKDVSSRYPSSLSRPYPPEFPPTPPMINHYSSSFSSNPFASPHNNFHAPSRSAPSMLSGTTMVP